MKKDNHRQGFISLHRSILDWEWYNDPNTCRLFIHLLLTAEYQDQKVNGKNIKRGQCSCSIRTLAKEVGLSERKVRTSLDRLKATHEVTQQSNPQSTVITIKNYDRFQKTTRHTTHEKKQKIDTANDTPYDTRQKHRTACGADDLIGVCSDSDTEADTAIDTRPTHAPIKNDTPTSNNKINNKRESTLARSEAPTYGEFKNVLLSPEEIDKLKGIVPGRYQDYIEQLSGYLASTGKKYKSHYATIRNWIRRDKATGKINEEDDNDVL